MKNDWRIDLRVTSFGRKEPGEGQTTLVRAESTGTESHYTCIKRRRTKKNERKMYV